MESFKDFRRNNSFFVIGVLIIWLLIFFPSASFPETWANSPGKSPSTRLNDAGLTKGDLNGDGNADLKDAILALQVITRHNPQGLRPDFLTSGMDVDGDNKIGLQEVLFALQAAAGLRSSQPGGALQGRLALTPDIGGLTADNMLVQLEGTNYSATLEEDGSFEFTDIPEGEYTLLVESKANQDYKYRTTLIIQNGRTYFIGDVDLSKTGTISGVATLENNLDNLGIEVYLAGTSFLARTAMDGSYRIYYVPTGIYTLVVESPGYQRVVIEGVEVKTSEDTVVKAVVLIKETSVAEGSIDGKVYGLDADGNKIALANASVGLSFPWMMKDLSRPTPINFFTLTNEQGYFLLEKIPEGWYTIEVSKEGYLPAKNEIYVRRGQNTTIDLLLIPQGPIVLEGSLDGKVYSPDATGNVFPLAKAVVSLYNPWSMGPALRPGPNFLTYTDENGYFLLEGIPEGSYIVYVMLDGYQPEKREIFIKGGRKTTLDFSLIPVNTGVGDIVGYVVEDTGPLDLWKPISGAKVSILMPDGTAKSVLTDIVGSFKFSGLMNGTYYLQVFKEGYLEGQGTVTVVPGQTSNLTIRLLPANQPQEFGNIAGFVKDPAGNSLPLARVLATRAMNSSEKPFAFEAVTKEDGSFIFNLVPAGIYKLVVTKEGYNMASQPVEIRNGETISVLITLKPVVLTTGSIAGTVQDVAGNPVAEAMIIVEIPIVCAQLDIVNCTHPVFQTSSGVDGSFKLANLPALDGYMVMVQKEGYEKTTKTSVNVVAGQTTWVELVINPLNSGVALLLLDENGNPLPRMMSKVSGVDSELYQVTDEWGKIVFYLKPGEYVVTAPVEQFYRIMGDMILDKTGAVSGDSLSMPVCYPEYFRCLDFGQTFIPVSQAVTVNEGQITQITFTIKRWLLKPEEGATISEFQPAFLWNAFPKAQSYTINVFDHINSYLVWTVAGYTETSVTYNYDGTGAALQPGRSYAWQIITDTGMVSNRRTFTMVDTTIPSIPFIIIERGAYSGISKQLTQVVRTKDEWLALWTAHKGNSLTANSLLPVVDFSRDMVIGIFAGMHNTGGYSVDIKQIAKNSDGQLLVDYVSVSPGLECYVTMAFTYPYQIVALPYSEAEVVFQKTEMIKDCLE